MYRYIGGDILKIEPTSLEHRGEIQPPDENSRELTLSECLLIVRNEVYNPRLHYEYYDLSPELHYSALKFHLNFYSYMLCTSNNRNAVLSDIEDYLVNAKKLKLSRLYNFAGPEAYIPYRGETYSLKYDHYDDFIKETFLPKLKVEDPEDWRLMMDDYSIDPDALELFRNTVFELLPEELELPDNESILTNYQPSKVWHNGKSVSQYSVMGEAGGCYSDYHIRGHRVYLNIEFGNTRDAIINDFPSLRNIQFIEKSILEVLKTLPESMYHLKPEDVECILDSEYDTESYYYHRDFKKDGLTKPRELILIIGEAIEDRYGPNVLTERIRTTYSRFDLIFKDGRIVETKKGHGLGMANALTTLIQIAVARMSLRDLDLKDTKFFAFNDDSFYKCSREEEALMIFDRDEYNIENLGMTLSKSKTFITKGRFVFLEQYYPKTYTNRRSIEIAAVYRTLLLKYPFERKMYLNSVGPLAPQVIPDVLEYCTPEFSQNEFNWSFSCGGWIPDRTGKISTVMLHVPDVIPGDMTAASRAHRRTYQDSEALDISLARRKFHLSFLDTEYYTYVRSKLLRINVKKTVQLRRRTFLTNQERISRMQFYYEQPSGITYIWPEISNDPGCVFSDEVRYKVRPSSINFAIENKINISKCFRLHKFEAYGRMEAQALRFEDPYEGARFLKYNPDYIWNKITVRGDDDHEDLSFSSLDLVDEFIQAYRRYVCDARILKHLIENQYDLDEVLYLRRDILTYTPELEPEPDPPPEEESFWTMDINKWRISDHKTDYYFHQHFVELENFMYIQYTYENAREVPIIRAASRVLVSICRESNIPHQVDDDGNLIEAGEPPLDCIDFSFGDEDY